MITANMIAANKFAANKFAEGEPVYSAEWTRLDNAAKIFPPSTTKDDTKVFRFCCELYEDVDAVILQHALNTGLEQFPFYRFIIRRGFFWYYFERSDIEPQVREEYKPPCAPLYDANRKTLLFELSYYRKRINLELYHALSDGVGALQFLKTIVYYYLLEKHRLTIDKNTRLGDNNASNEQRSGDAFDKYYSREKPVKIPKLPHAYSIKGERLPRLRVIEGHVSAAALLQKTHEHPSVRATMGEFVAALLICAIHDGMKVRDENRPVSLTIPVDLRRYFATPTARNFFSTINVSHDFATQGKRFEDVLARVRLSFKAQLRPEKIHERLNSLSSLEHILPLMVVPLAVKAPVLKTAAAQAEKDDSAAFSNIGKIAMPQALVPHIRLFSLSTSTKRPHVSITSFEDNLVISFSSPFVSSDVERSFFRTLSGFGLSVEIVSNSIGSEAQHAVLS